MPNKFEETKYYLFTFDNVRQRTFIIVSINGYDRYDDSEVIYSKL